VAAVVFLAQELSGVWHAKNGRLRHLQTASVGHLNGTAWIWEYDFPKNLRQSVIFYELDKNCAVYVTKGLHTVWPEV
jgi:hypothetical protein